MALSFWRRRGFDPMPRRDFDMAVRGDGDPRRGPSDDYLIEGTEEPVQPYVDTRRLHHLRVERIQLDTLRVELGQDVTVGEQHGRTLAACR